MLAGYYPTTPWAYWGTTLVKAISVNRDNQIVAASLSDNQAIYSVDAGANYLNFSPAKTSSSICATDNKVCTVEMDGVLSCTASGAGVPTVWQTFPGTYQFVAFRGEKIWAVSSRDKQLYVCDGRYPGTVCKKSGKTFTAVSVSMYYVCGMTVEAYPRIECARSGTNFGGALYPALSAWKFVATHPALTHMQDVAVLANGRIFGLDPNGSIITCMPDWNTTATTVPCEWEMTETDPPAALKQMEVRLGKLCSVDKDGRVICTTYVA